MKKDIMVKVDLFLYKIIIYISFWFFIVSKQLKINHFIFIPFLDGCINTSIKFLILIPFPFIPFHSYSDYIFFFVLILFLPYHLVKHARSKHAISSNDHKQGPSGSIVKAAPFLWDGEQMWIIVHRYQFLLNLYICTSFRKNIGVRKSMVLIRTYLECTKRKENLIGGWSITLIMS